MENHRPDDPDVDGGIWRGQEAHKVGLCWVALGDHEEAMEWLSLAEEELSRANASTTQAFPDYDSLYQAQEALGLACLRQGKFAQARDWLVKAVNTRAGYFLNDPPEKLTRSLEALADCHEHLGDQTAARVCRDRIGALRRP